MPMAISGMTTFLWFDTEAHDAATYYCSLFPDARITNIDYYPSDAQLTQGNVLTVNFELFGQSFTALNAGPGKPHSDAISFQIFCDTQEEVDQLWYGLIADGGAESMCGWCRDRWGVAWQIIPRRLGELLSDSDSKRSGAAFAAMRTMHKIDIAGLNSAVESA